MFHKFVARQSIDFLFNRFTDVSSCAKTNKDSEVSSTGNDTRLVTFVSEIFAEVSRRDFEENLLDTPNPMATDQSRENRNM